MKRIVLVITALAFVGLLATPRVGHAQAIDDSNVAAKIAAAKTAADHQALADYFTSQAATAAHNVSLHEAMMTAYHQVSGKSAEAWTTHCKNLIHTYKQQEKDYTALADEQAKLAKSAH